MAHPELNTTNASETKLSAQERQSATLPDSMPNPYGRNSDRLVISCQQQGLLNLRIADDVSDVVRRYFGTGLPTKPNHFTSNGERCAVWLGPDEILLFCADHDVTKLHHILSIQLACYHFALTVVSDALLVYHLSGARVRDVLAKGCALDLHNAVFRPRHCAQSNLDRATVTLLCEDEDRFLLVCRRSFADYVEAWLKDASIEFGYAVKQTASNTTRIGGFI